MEWAQNETRRRSQVLCTIRDYKRNPVDSWNNSASPLLYTKCFQTLTPLTTYDLSPAHLLMASPDIAGEDSVQVRLVPANQSLRLPKHFLRSQSAPRGRLTNHHYRLLCDLAIQDELLHRIRMDLTDFDIPPSRCCKVVINIDDFIELILQLESDVSNISRHELRSHLDRCLENTRPADEYVGTLWEASVMRETMKTVSTFKRRCGTAVIGIAHRSLAIRPEGELGNRRVDHLAFALAQTIPLSFVWQAAI